jgi:aspartyl-tRNA(Asn)/glutamyl-tRNA(Gln) amidotransferase subunit A
MTAAPAAAELCWLSLEAAAELIRRRELSPLELIQATLDRVELENRDVNCLLSVAGDQALARARALTQKLGSGSYLGPLHGIPLSLKDNIATVDLPTTAGSTVLGDWRPKRPAAVTSRLERSGAIVIGKSHMYEFAYGAFHPKYGETRNPWNLSYTSGGSSSGSAAAVAAGLGQASIGTDTGGSIRIPASFCGVVGLKPTFGRVSRSGVIPVSSNLDHVGPMARTVTDVALLLQAIASRPPTTLVQVLESGVQGLRLGVPRYRESDLVDPEISAAVLRAVEVLEGEGAQLREVDLPDLLDARTTMWIISSVEAAEYHRNHLRERGDEYHPLVRLLLEQGERVPGTEYVHAQRVRRVMIRKMRQVWADVDVLALPATAVHAFPIGTTTLRVGEREEHWQPVVNRLTPLFNLTGSPALSLPCGMSREGLPIGLQLAARAFDEATLLRTARTYERATSWHTLRPGSNGSSSRGR